MFDRTTAKGEWVSLPGKGTAFIKKIWEEPFRQAGLGTVEVFLQDVGTPLPKRIEKNRFRARLSLNVNGEVRTVYLKRFERETLARALSRLVFPGESPARAHVAAEVLEQIRASGISVPEPLAFGYSAGSPFTRRSFLVTLEVSGATIGAQLGASGDLSHQPFPEKLCFVQQFAAFVSTFHQTGWRHRDFHLYNILGASKTALSGSEPGWDFSLLDLDRALNPSLLTWWWRIKDLAHLNASAIRLNVSRNWRLRFARCYLGVKKISPVQRLLLRAIDWTTRRRLARRARKNAARN